MANDWVNRATSQHISGPSPADMTARFGGVFVDGGGNAASNADWLWSPDLTGVAGFSTQYWVVSGDTVTLMDQAARDEVDAQIALDALTSNRTFNKGELNRKIILKAVVLVMIDQINVLRIQAGLGTVTPAQGLAAIEAKIDTLQPSE